MSKSITLKEFRPHGVTSSSGAAIITDEQAKHELFFRSYTTGPDGARYELLREKHHTAQDVHNAKNYLYKNFDVVSIDVLTEKEEQPAVPPSPFGEGQGVRPKPFTAYVHFKGDPSVGCPSYGYIIELPKPETWERDIQRQRIKDFYTEMDGEFVASSVIFSDENDND